MIGEAVARQVLQSLKLGDSMAHLGRRMLQRIAGVFVMMAIGVLMSIFAAAFASWGGYVAMVPAMGPARAALFVAVALVVVALLFFLIGWRFISHESRVKTLKVAAPAPAGLAGLISVEDAETIIRLLKDRVEDDPIAATIVSLCSGYVTGSMVFRK
jgi:hypothetical protein